MVINPTRDNIHNVTQTDCNSYVAILDRSLEVQSNETFYGILCWPTLQVYNVSVAPDASNLVQDHAILSTLSGFLSPFSNLQGHNLTFHTQLLNTNDLVSERTGQIDGYFEYGYIGRYNWLGLLTARLRERSPTYADGVQNTSTLEYFANSIYAQAFVSFWALYSDDFLAKASSPAESSGTVS